MNPYSRGAFLLSKSLKTSGQGNLFYLEETLGPQKHDHATKVPGFAGTTSDSAELLELCGPQSGGLDHCDDSSITNPFLTSESESSGDEVPEMQSSKRASRKRLRHPEQWKQSIRKRKRDCGEEYVSRQRKLIPSKKIKFHKCGACRFNCNSNINEAAREKLFHEYWGMGEHNRQREYISQHVKRKPTKKLGRRKSFVLSYHLTVGEVSHQVCKQTFLSSLGIGEKTVYYTLKNRSDTGVAKADLRGKKKSSRATTDEMKQGVMEHIKSFPTVESHYCRASTQKRYLDADLSISKMHELYVENCSQSNTTPAKQCTYRKIFNEEFNFGFHKPKKDACNVCSTYTNSTNQERIELEKGYKEHQMRKEAARSQKENDKILGNQDRSTKVCTFDLQAVLQSPKSNISSVYYKRKLNSYNFTIYDLVTKECNCFMWHEAVAKRGSNDIASCLCHYLLSQPERKFKLYSDACGGQNRNRNMSAMLHHIVKTSSIESIEHTYMESGHSQMEVDSVHATIERAARNLSVGAPIQYQTIVALARRGNPYKVHNLDTEFFQDFSSIHIPKKNTYGDAIKWMKIKRFMYTKDQTAYSYDYEGEMLEISIETPRKSDRINKAVRMPQLYSTPPSITEAKYNDLIALCKSGVINKIYHSFYAALPHTIKSKYEDEILMQEL